MESQAPVLPSSFSGSGRTMPLSLPQECPCHFWSLRCTHYAGICESETICFVSVADFNQYSHIGDGQKKSEDPTDFLQDALQERLQNEAATSRLIAQITDMKSRLDDILARPSKGHLEGCEKDGFEYEKIKLPCESSEKEYNRSNDSQLKERTVAEDFTEASQVANKPKCCMYLDHEGFAHENQVANRMKCFVHNDYRVHALDSLKTNKIMFHPPSKASAASIACEQLKPESERSLLQQKRNGEHAFVIETVRSGKSSMAVTGADQENDCNHIGLSCHNKECGILQRVSQGLGELETEGNILAPIEEDMHERTTIVQANAGYRFMKEHPIGIMKMPLSSSRHKCPLRASNLLPTHKGSLVKPLFGSKESKENASLCLESRKESSKLKEFLDAENSLLASLERLDVKLAMASANISNSSRTSLVSAGHQSTKSAPCMASGKSGSDAYSINSTMFFSRPTTSQAGGISLTSRRRQNVGLTNVPKERIKHFQTCNLQQTRKFKALSSGNQQEERKASAGTIILHQNAEFLFS